ncbi:hypothetical protein [uncultured Litoreibacter sp.]|uniref:hypothetical protein n=1 Tax=uncultured Litoreibacter sp. TaxID=1392394 RepID=UPI00260A6590|nr:hypothetical protein [uncultured Litoreibacter sp.]
MQLFNAKAVLAKIENEGAAPASSASSDHNEPPQEAEEATGLAQIAENVSALRDAVDAAEERAAVLEFDAGMTREIAEARALQSHGDSIVRAIASGSHHCPQISTTLIDRLVSWGRIQRGLDGQYTVMRGSNS